MEKIKLSNEATFDLIPMGIEIKEKSKSFTISSELTPTEIETAFTDVSTITHLSEADETLATYYDGIGLKSVKHDIENNTYTVEISTDEILRKMQQMQAQIDALTAV